MTISMYQLLKINTILQSDNIQKHTWIKVNDKDDYLRLILKDNNKLHMFGLSKIEKIYDGTDMIIFRLYSSDIRTASLSYVKETKEIYFECCKIESDDLKSSIESYLSLLNKDFRLSIIDIENTPRIIIGIYSSNPY